MIIDMSHLRLTIDHYEDFKLIKIIIQNLYSENPKFSLVDIITFLNKNPEIANMNAHISQTNISNLKKQR